MIVFCSQEYKESSNCRLECKYAKRLEKGGKLKLIFVMMQDGYFDKADGWLGMYLDDSLWYGLWKDSQMDGAVDSISKLLGDSVKNVSGGVSARVSSAPATAPGAAPAAGGGATAAHAIKAANSVDLENLDINGVIELFHNQFGLTQYDEIIKENAINGKVLMDITADDLVGIGMNRLHFNGAVRKLAKLL
jgi:hypothetical protein